MPPGCRQSGPLKCPAFSVHPDIRHATPHYGMVYENIGGGIRYSSVPIRKMSQFKRGSKRIVFMDSQRWTGETIDSAVNEGYYLFYFGGKNINYERHGVSNTVFADGYGRTDLYGGDEAEMRRTLSSLLPALAGRVLYPGHGAYGFRRNGAAID